MIKRSIEDVSLYYSRSDTTKLSLKSSFLMSLSYSALWNVHIQCLSYVRLATHDMKLTASPDSHSSNDNVNNIDPSK